MDRIIERKMEGNRSKSEEEEVKQDGGKEWERNRNEKWRKTKRGMGREDGEKNGGIEREGMKQRGEEKTDGSVKEKKWFFNGSLDNLGFLEERYRVLYRTFKVSLRGTTQEPFF